MYFISYELEISDLKIDYSSFNDTFHNNNNKLNEVFTNIIIRYLKCIKAILIQNQTNMNKIKVFSQFVRILHILR